jgi:hypothetical protein
MAQLDIGFARSETELAVLELQGGYDRAHLTRYTALYTSLTTRYAFRHEDPGALVQPFRMIARRGESETTLHYRHGNEVSLEGFVVPSNTVDMIHGEQMIDLDGPLEVLRNAQARWQISNRTGVPLRGVGVLHRVDADKIETAWVGELGPHANAELAFRAHAIAAKDATGPWWNDRRETDVETKAQPVLGEFSLRRLIDLGEDARDLCPGEFRLVGWTDQKMPGLEIEPAAPQSQHAAVVVAHLRHANDGDTRPDVNTKTPNPQSRTPNP